MIRYCCSVLKEGGGTGRKVLSGIRAAESPKRAKRNIVEGCLHDKKEHVLKNMLEAINKNEAELSLAMLKKNLKIKFLTAKLVNEVFPDIEIQKRKVAA